MSDHQETTCDSPSPAKTYKYQLGSINKVATKDLYLSTRLSDVHFSFGSDGHEATAIRVPAHKHLLAVVSDVFERMFYGELKETGDVAITDVSVAVFKEFLQFFYLNEVELSAEHIAGVMYLGQKYNVEPCIDACADILKRHVADENVCTVLALAILYEQKDLLNVCDERILLNTADIFQTDAFLECDEKVLAHILKMKLLSCSEVNVFEACIAWVKAKSQQNTVSKAAVQKHLGGLYYDIRFASMTIQEFCALEAKYSDVLRDDFHTITRLIARAAVESAHFNRSPRQAEWNRNEIIECNRDWVNLDRTDVQSQPCESNADEKTTFSTSHPLLLGKFECNGIYYDKRDLRSKLLVQIEVTEARTLGESDVKVLSTMTANLDSELTAISLPHPILIRPNFFYTIFIKQIPEDYWFDSFELRSSMILRTDKNIEFHNDKTVNGKFFGLIYFLNFNEI